MSETPVVLIVDDHRDTCEVYAMYLSAIGFATATASDSEEALACARNLRPHVIVTDLKLPRISGVDLIRQLRAEPGGHAIKIIVVTACAFPSDARDANAAGCDAFLLKPCVPDVLAAEVERVLTTSEQ